MSIQTIRNRKYPGKEIFEKYMSMGAAATYEKIRNWLLAEHGLEKKQMGAVWAMWRYAARNAEEAYPLYRVWYFEYASAIRDRVVNPNASFQDFVEDLQHRIEKSDDCILSRSAYRNFCNKYNLKLESPDSPVVK